MTTKKRTPEASEPFTRLLAELGEQAFSSTNGSELIGTVIEDVAVLGPPEVQERALDLLTCVYVAGVANLALTTASGLSGNIEQAEAGIRRMHATSLMLGKLGESSKRLCQRRRNDVYFDFAKEYIAGRAHD
ncbi:MAG: hypothetical protein OXR66_02365 [Candidatus Woesearchaeota archaeon]|nr:hypothetical protein [Candidatus Woesearchaeota archaeon]